MSNPKFEEYKKEREPDRNLIRDFYKSVFNGDPPFKEEVDQGLKCYVAGHDRAIAESEIVKRLVEANNWLDSALSALLESDEIECRADEDCDHCQAIGAQKFKDSVLADYAATVKGIKGE